MENSHLYRVDDTLPLSGQSFAHYKYPFPSFPVLHSHVQPHLVVFNLMDKLASDSPALCTVGSRYSQLADLWQIYEVWTNVRLPPRSTFHVDIQYTLYPGFQVDIDPNDGLAGWDVPGARAYKLATSPRSQAFLQKLHDIGFSEGSSLCSDDSGNGGEERFFQSLEEDKLWAADIRMWQASSAIADPGFYELWTEPEEYILVPVRQSLMSFERRSL